MRSGPAVIVHDIQRKPIVLPASFQRRLIHVDSIMPKQSTRPWPADSSNVDTHEFFLRSFATNHILKTYALHNHGRVVFGCAYGVGNALRVQMIRISAGIDTTQHHYIEMRTPPSKSIGQPCSEQ